MVPQRLWRKMGRGHGLWGHGLRIRDHRFLESWSLRRAATDPPESDRLQQPCLLTKSREHRTHFAPTSLVNHMTLGPQPPLRATWIFLGVPGSISQG